jgi:hypothetical protein
MMCIYESRGFVFGFKQFQYGTKIFHIHRVAGTGRGEAQNGTFFKHNATFLSLLTSNTLCFSTDGVSLVHISICLYAYTDKASA